VRELPLELVGSRTGEEEIGQDHERARPGVDTVFYHPPPVWFYRPIGGGGPRPTGDRLHDPTAPGTAATVGEQDAVARGEARELSAYYLAHARIATQEGFDLYRDRRPGPGHPGADIFGNVNPPEEKEGDDVQSG
jgi:hypothetical protein